MNPVSAGKLIETEEFKIMFFDTVHDVPEPLGFIIWNKIENKKIFFATDTAALNYDIAGIHTFLLEVNYIDDIINKNVEDGELEQFVANRVERSHFGLADAVDFLSGCDLKKTRKIFPIHMSKGNCDPVKVKEVIENKFNIECVVDYVGREILL